MRRDQLAKRVHQIFEDHRQVFGSPRIHEQLIVDGERYSVNTVAKIMCEEGLVAKRSKRFKPVTTDSKHDRPVADNLLQRDVTAKGPNQKWVADLPYFLTQTGWSYLAVGLDVFSRRVVGWSIADQRRREALADAMDELDRKHGRHTVNFASMCDALDNAPTRNAFTQIPKLYE